MSTANIIKGIGYRATETKEGFILSFPSGGHIPGEESVEITKEELASIIINPLGFSKIVADAQRRKENFRNTLLISSP